MKEFKLDFKKFLDKIKNKENFAITRFGDGELSIIEGNSLNLLNKGAGEFAYDATNDKYSKSRELLEESFNYQDESYFVGVACRCCVGNEKFKHMVNLSEQNESNLTWANIFVNGNFNKFRSEFIPELKNRKLILVCHEDSNTDNLPFDVEMVYKVKADAWLHNLPLIDVLKNEINNGLVDYVFLITAGPFANILVQQLHKHNNKNTYLDIGSVLDGYLGLPLTRGYLNGAPTLRKVCIW
jgi:hypothetical protein